MYWAVKIVKIFRHAFHQLPLERKIPDVPDPILQSSPVTTQMIPIPSGNVTLGLSRSGREFGWDNEYGSYAIDLPAFKIDRYMITNGQFLQTRFAACLQRSRMLTVQLMTLCLPK